MKKIISLLIFLPVVGYCQWNQIGNAIIGQAAGDNCGWSTAISADGNIVAMGSIFSGGGKGQVRIFDLSDGVWTQIGADINGETGGDQTGQAVSLSTDGSVVAIGEPFNNDLGFTSGQVRVFKNVNNTWTQVGQDLYGQNAVASAGTTVDLSADGTTVVFGAPNTEVNGFTSFTGNVEVYQLEGNTWVQKGEDINGDGSIIKFGQSVSLAADGNTVAIGQTGDPSNFNTSQIGKVRVYQFVNNQWLQKGNTILGQAERDEFGFRISLSAAGNILAISSPASNVVVVYQFNDGVWSQVGEALFGENAGDNFGSSLSLSKSGSWLAVGARRYTSGSSLGRAYVFENQDGIWTQIDSPMAGESNGDQFGFSVAISQDGSRAVVGAINNDVAGNNAGQVRVFENTLLSTFDYEGNLVSFYPNPSKEVIHFSAAQNIDTITVYNLLGQKVLEKTVNSKDFSIDISSLSNATYLVEARSDKASQTLKLIKN